MFKKLKTAWNSFILGPLYPHTIEVNPNEWEWLKRLFDDPPEFRPHYMSYKGSIILFNPLVPVGTIMMYRSNRGFPEVRVFDLNKTYFCKSCGKGSNKLSPICADCDGDMAEL